MGRTQPERAEVRGVFGKEIAAEAEKFFEIRERRKPESTKKKVKHRRAS